MNLSIADLRRNYTLAGFSEADAAISPIDQFKIWFQQAVDANLTEPNAMTLATISSEGKPSARIVLLKDVDDRGFVFFTNYESVKGQHLLENPQAALVFFWIELERQVRVEGKAEKVSSAESDAYFSTRPRGSQLGAWVSKQTEVIASREVLQSKLEELEQKYADKEIPRPPHWGGFRLIPSEFEFWQGRPNRLHDRLRYRLAENGNWIRERLSP
ncbi:MAG: pyridoxamine 5'-phosphate oxidase [Prochloraceae cyanobacterium]|nr:pyridoxamine 5'-phosphate oxidase [Prochloraceae cyanobacterium]